MVMSTSPGKPLALNLRARRKQLKCMIGIFRPDFIWKEENIKIHRNGSKRTGNPCLRTN
jgi:hypothetical protein